MAFHIGQKVVCVDARETGIDRNVLTKGAVYTVRWIGPRASTHPTLPEMNTPLAIRLIEVPRRTHSDNPFSIARFRPVVEKSTESGMAILREILDRETIKDDKPVKIPVRENR